MKLKHAMEFETDPTQLTLYRELQTIIDKIALDITVSVAYPWERDLNRYDYMCSFWDDMSEEEEKEFAELKKKLATIHKRHSEIFDRNLETLGIEI